MSEKEAKKRECVMFQKNTILINENDRLKGQLEQAKEIIKELKGGLSMYSGNYQKELLDAEQFLKEIKEKD